MSSILRIQFPEDFAERYQAYKANFPDPTLKPLLIVTDDTDEKTPTGTWWAKGDLPGYDKKNRQIKLSGKVSQIPLKALNKVVVCDAVFDVPLGEWVTESNVISNLYKGGQSPRSFYDAIRLLNTQIERDFGIKEFFQYETSHVRIRAELFQ